MWRAQQIDAPQAVSRVILPQRGARPLSRQSHPVSCQRLTRRGHLERGRSTPECRVEFTIHTQNCPVGSAGPRTAVRRSVRLMSEGPQIYLVPLLVGC
jgi:hypothetical protein